MIPLAGVIHLQHGGADFAGFACANGQGQCDPGAAIGRMIHQNSAAMLLSSAADDHKAQAQTEPAFFQTRFTGMAGEEIAPDILRDTAAVIQNAQMQFVALALELRLDGTAPGRKFQSVGENIQYGAFQQFRIYR